MTILPEQSAEKNPYLNNYQLNIGNIKKNIYYAKPNLWYIFMINSFNSLFVEAIQAGVHAYIKCGLRVQIKVYSGR